MDVETRTVIRRINTSTYPNLPSNACMFIHRDLENNIWIGTNQGLVKYTHELNELIEPRSKNNFDFKSENNIARSITEDTNGNIWLGCNAGLIKHNYRDKITELLPVKLNSKQYKVLCIHNSNDGKIWLGTNGAFIFSIDTNSDLKLQTIDPVWFNNKSDIPIKAIGQFENTLWVGTQGVGLYYYNTISKKIHQQTAHKGISGSLSWDVILSLFKSECGTMWVGTYGKGCNYWHPSIQKFNYYRKTANNRLSLDLESINSIALDNKNRIWVSGYGGGSSLNILDRSQNKVLSLNTEIDNHYNYLHLDKTEPERYMWACRSDYSEQLYRIDILNRTIDKAYDISKNHLTIYHITEADNNLWLSSTKGIIRFNKQSGTSKYYYNLLGDSANVATAQVFNTTTDADGWLWLGTNKGLIHYHPESGKKETYTINSHKSRSISSNIVLSVLKDKNGNIWMGTDNGLNKLNPSSKTITTYNTKNGLSSDLIISLQEDEQGNIWMSSNQGLISLNPISNIVTNYTKDDGLQSNDFAQNSSFKAADGELFFGGTSGLNSFLPDKLKLNTCPANIKISQLNINNQTINFNKNSNAKQKLKKNIEYTKEINLTHNDRIVSFEFSSLNYISSHRNFFSYKLDGFDDEWSKPTQRNFVSFTNLRHGEYTLMVKASNNDGLWSKDIKELKIVVTPPFYHTLWFRTLLVLSIISLTLGFYFIRIRLLKNNEKKLKKLVKERTTSLQETNVILEEKSEEIMLQKELLEQKNEEIVTQYEALEQHRTNLEGIVSIRTQELEIAKNKAEESDRLKSAFLANMSHEIRTPMNAIIGFSTLLKQSELSDDEKDNFIDQIQTNGDSLLHLIDDIIDIAKIEAGQLQLIPKAIELHSLLNELESNFNQETVRLNKANLKLLLSLPQQEPKHFVSDPYRIKQVLSNLLSNAIKYTNEGSIEFGYTYESNSMLLFYVKDTGIGIASNYLQTIFDRFNKAANPEDRLYSGTGLGLSISKQIVTNLGGEMKVESKLEKGSRFSFTLPLIFNNSKS
ncbi:two-component regulator propeller domain-containing protein [Carboxylicivirga sp. N1Y90]|uniref:two-component regulator propeller domain-containing protein n=1 Tax=Carboxylicivirga fragile TaxID=3417571 RepID=UPI003D32E123|nr:hypothetical protein [Marinilabiliaceae bacterium N1Y90]